MPHLPHSHIFAGCPKGEQAVVPQSLQRIVLGLTCSLGMKALGRLICILAFYRVLAMDGANDGRTAVTGLYSLRSPSLSEIVSAHAGDYPFC